MIHEADGHRAARGGRPRSRRRTVRAAPLTGGLLAAALPTVHAGDTYSTPLLTSDSTAVTDWERAVLGAAPGWVRALMRARDVLVRPFGLHRPTHGGRHGFPELARTRDEVLVGLDDRHLSFRVCVRVDAGWVHVVTLVQLHNTLGRLYWAVVRWFHPLVVRALVRRVPVPLEGHAPADRARD